MGMWPSPAQRMDIVLPEGEGPFPVVVFIHGGGFLVGDKRRGVMASVVKMVSQGYAVASLNYRLSSEARWPAQIHDAKAAIRFLRARGREYRLETEKLAVCGNSAGGHLSCMLAAAPNHPELENRSMGYGEQSDHIDGLVSWYAMTDLVRDAEQRRCLNLEPATFEGMSMDDVVTRFLGISAQDDPELAAAASPIRYVTKDFPPALFQHGTADRIVPYLQSVEMADRINMLCGIDHSEVILFPREGHGHEGDRFKSDENLIRCIQFIDSIYGIRRGTPMVLPGIRLCDASELV